jgi:hypothetical protein
MELGHYGWGKKARLFQQNPVFLESPAPANSNYALLNLGNGPFDGQTPGAFHGSASGTFLAINAPIGYAGALIDTQAAGTTRFQVGISGDTYVLSDPFALTTFGSLNIGTKFFTGAGQFAGDANGTYLAINSPSSFIGNAIDVQTNGTSSFSISYNGYTNITNTVWISQNFNSSVLGYLSIIPGPGTFTGSANGTGIAINMLNGFTGNIVDWQLNGAARFKVDNSGAVTAASTVTAGTNAAPFPLTNSITLKSSDSTMTSNTAFVDGPTVSCVKGTWLLLACCTVVCGTTAGTLTGKLWDGTTVISSSETRQVASQASSITLAGVVSPGSTTSYKMSVATTTGATNASTLKAAAVNNGAGNNATWITAVRIG